MSTTSTLLKDNEGSVVQGICGQGGTALLEFVRFFSHGIWIPGDCIPETTLSQRQKLIQDLTLVLFSAHASQRWMGSLMVLLTQNANTQHWTCFLFNNTINNNTQPKKRQYSTTHFISHISDSSLSSLVNTSHTPTPSLTPTLSSSHTPMCMPALSTPWIPSPNRHKNNILTYLHTYNKHTPKQPL